MTTGAPAVSTLTVVAATDWLDGYLARRLHAISSFGST
ncbi:MAG: CDP-alcohol phosphatidyltransferase family protein, partial [Gemmatimonadota bacterium]